MLLLLCTLTDARADKGHIEYTALLNSDTMHNMQSFSSYSKVLDNSSIQMYGGLELVWYQLNPADDFEFNPRVFIGATTGDTIAAFAEVGSNLVGLLEYFNGESRDCTQVDCTPDFSIKTGMRIRIYSQFSISLFYQRINFGDFHDRLTGNHRLYGASIGLHY